PAPPAEPPGEVPDAVTRIEPQVVLPPPEPPRRVRSEDVERLLSYFEHIRKLPPGDFAREADSARAAFGRTRSDFDRARYAMLLSVPNTSLNDDQRAFDLLEPLVKNPASALHGLALLVSAHVQERRRLESGMQNLQQNVQGLQQKLDALMSLERSLMNREQPPPPRKR
ncbi:MAG TPA: hypothetical protein VFP00_01850, partial [Burkholderiales bacterium]|nr:hypothetical protein [Burkholderiales bacterium]